MSNRRNLRMAARDDRKIKTQLRLRESTAVLDRPVTEVVELHESHGCALKEAPTQAAGHLVVDLVLIESGWNASGTKFYPPDVLARDMAVAFPKGSHQHWDHPTLTESEERPERSLSTLAAVLIEAPYTPDGGRTIRAKARVFSLFREAVREMWQDIGVSINADGSGTWGEREGRCGFIVESIDSGRSVDFVTKPGAGGKVLSLIEAERATALREARTFGGWLESRLHLTLTQYADEAYGDGRLTRDERLTLSGAIGDALQIWTARVETEAPQLFARDLYDEPAVPAPAVVPVLESNPEPPAPAPTPVTAPTPVVTPATETPAPPTDLGQGTEPDTTQHKEEGTVPEPIEDTKLREAVTAADAAKAKAEQERETALREAATFKNELARFRAVETARPIATTVLAESDLPAAAQARILASVVVSDRVPLTESLGMDETALRARLAAEITAEGAYLAQLREADGEGQVRGAGTAAVAAPAAPVIDAGAVRTALIESYTARGMTLDAATKAANGRPF